MGELFFFVRLRVIEYINNSFLQVFSKTEIFCVIESFSSTGGNDCEKYDHGDADAYNHKWKEIVAARALIIFTVILGLPLIIILIIAMCSECCIPASFFAAVVFAVLQLGCIGPTCALMIHGFVTREKDGTKIGWCTWVTWVAALCSIGLTIIACSACCQCWKKCDKKHGRR